MFVYLFGIIVQLIMLLCGFFLPKNIAFEVINSISLPVMIIYPVGTVFLGLMLLKQKSRLKIETELHESEEKFRILYNNSPDMYLSASPNDNIVKFCNETLLKKTGYSNNEIIGNTVYKIYHEECYIDVKTTIEEFKINGRIQNKELILKRIDGVKIPVSINVEAIRGENGEIIYSITSLRDITERKRTEKIQNIVLNNSFIGEI